MSAIGSASFSLAQGLLTAINIRLLLKPFDSIRLPLDYVRKTEDFNKNSRVGIRRVEPIKTYIG